MGKKNKKEVAEDLKKDSSAYDKVFDSTSSQEKIWVYLMRLSESKEFQRKVKEMRKKYSLPEKGLKEVLTGRGFKGNEYIMIPKELNDLGIEEAVRKWTKELGLSWFWSESLTFYIVYNEWYYFWSYGGLIQVDDFNQFLNEPSPFGDEDGDVDYVKGIVEEYPVSISINPYACERDIIDFVKKTYKTHIEPMQKKYRSEEVMIGKLRKRSNRILSRNNFIYENRHLSAKQITSLVADKFGDILDYPYISKIIKEEESRRK